MQSLQDKEFMLSLQDKEFTSLLYKETVHLSFLSHNSCVHVYLIFCPVCLWYVWFSFICVCWMLLVVTVVVVVTAVVIVVVSYVEVFVSLPFLLSLTAGCLSKAFQKSKWVFVISSLHPDNCYSDFESVNGSSPSWTWKKKKLVWVSYCSKEKVLQKERRSCGHNQEAPCFLDHWKVVCSISIPTLPRIASPPWAMMEFWNPWIGRRYLQQSWESANKRFMCPVLAQAKTILCLGYWTLRASGCWPHISTS